MGISTDAFEEILRKLVGAALDCPTRNVAFGALTRGTILSVAAGADEVLAVREDGASVAVTAAYYAGGLKGHPSVDGLRSEADVAEEARLKKYLAIC